MNYTMKEIGQRLALITLFAALTGAAAYVAYKAYELRTPQSHAARTVIKKDEHRISQALFSPDDNIQETLIGLIDAEKERIRITAFSITNDDIAQALIHAHRRGVDVEAIVDGSNATTPHSKVSHLHKKGIHLWMYPSVQRHHNSPVRSGIMHNKFVLFDKSLMDRAVLWTGSFNFTRSANNYNEENVVITDDTDLIEAYQRQFEKLKKRCIELK